MLTKVQIEQCLTQYYKENCGVNNADVWYEQPATNVWMFRRDGKIITLKCHILTGMVTEMVEE